MKISLPESFSYGNIAEVKNEILYIYHLGSYESLMRRLTYAINVPNKCYYCDIPLNRSILTLDHKIPRDLGGISIPNNLCICCNKCNETKSNLLEEEFKEYLSLESNTKIHYLNEKLSNRDDLKKQFPNYFSDNWITDIEVENVNDILKRPKDFKNKKYVKVKKAYKKYGKFLRPIIVDKNYTLLSGHSLLLYARVRGIASIPAIILENVEVVINDCYHQ